MARGMTIMLEELKELGVDGADYDLYKINIGAGDQFGSDFVKKQINPQLQIRSRNELKSKSTCGNF